MFKSFRAKAVLACLLFSGLALLATPGVAAAQHCKARFGSAFQLVSAHSFAEQDTAEIVRTVDSLFGPRQEVCGESGYHIFVQQFRAYASSVLRRKGAAQDGSLVAAQEILKRWPLRVRWDGPPDNGAWLHQLRSDLGVLSAEVGVTPGVQALLSAVDRLETPKPASKKVAVDENGLQVVVPTIPLPPWAVVSLYEIDQHLKRQEYGSARNQVALIIQWLKLVGSGTPPSEIQIAPVPASTAGPPPSKP